MIVNIHAAKTQLSKLLSQVAAGQEVVIAKSGRPIAKLVPFHAHPPRQAGLWHDTEIPASFFDPLPESELKAWEN